MILQSARLVAGLLIVLPALAQWDDGLLKSYVMNHRAATTSPADASAVERRLSKRWRTLKRGETFPIARVTGSVETAGNIYIENALAKLFPDSPGSMAGMTFSEAFGTVLSNDLSARRLTRLVIFDQFEEIFTLRPELIDQRREFFEQLGDCLATHPQLSLLLSMREDYLADLEEYSALLPDRLRARMRLERLGEASALEAIREPAAQAGLPFAAGTAEELVDNLRRIRTGNGFALGDYVEPVQLQIVCRQLWSRLMEEVLPRKSEIDAEDIRAHANVDGALSQFIVIRLRGLGMLA
jgi:hypothetical protein